MNAPYLADRHTLGNMFSRNKKAHQAPPTEKATLSNATTDNKSNVTATLPPLPHHTVIIIGGGVGGLYTAKRLLENSSLDVKLFESRGTLGGRVVTTRGEDGKPLFNDFAWRIGETNSEMLKLAKELGIELREQFTPPPAPVNKHPEGSQETGSGDKKHTDCPTHPEGRAPLSTFASFCLESTSGADRVDRESGYAGRTAQIAFPGESHGSLNYCVVNGCFHIASNRLQCLVGPLLRPPTYCCS